MHISRVKGPSVDQLKAYLVHHPLQVGVDDNGEFQQIYFVYDNLKIYVTDGGGNHTSPVTSGKYIAWIETPYQQNSSLVFLYDVLTKSKTQLTYFGTNLNPSIDGNHVVWEAHSSNKSTIEYYDGNTTQQISDDYPSVRPAIQGNQIAYARYLGPNSWQVVTYDSGSKESKVITSGPEANAWPRFVGGKLTTDNP